LDMYRPLVWEFSRLKLTGVVISKRRLLKLVTGGYVRGWDDPRMPTIRGLRRRGYTQRALNDLCERAGITTNDTLQDYSLLEHCAREDLDTRARAMVIVHPLKVTITNWDKEDVVLVDALNHPKDTTLGTRKIPLTKVLYIDRSDFRMEDMKGYKRLAPQKEVGLNHIGASIKCDEVITDKDNNPIELKATICWKPAKKQVSGFIHWVSEPTPGQEPLKIELRLYDKLFTVDDPDNMKDTFLDVYNKNSLEIVKGAFAEPSLKDIGTTGEARQFERTGFFCVDPDTNLKERKLIWNKVVGLKEANWEK